MCIMTKQRIWLIILIVAGVSVTHCDKNSVSSEGLASLSPSEKTLVSSGNSFGFKLFPKIIQDEPNQNVFISPLSASMALGMTYNGAGGTTQEAMATALELQGLSIPEANASYQRVISLLLNLDPKVRMQIANSIWYRQEYGFEEEFLNTNRTFFDAVVSGMDFNNPTTVDVINQWVENQTNSRIRNIITQIDPQTVMFLINAIYFKGDWAHKFDEDDTRDDQFQKPDNTFIPVKMMNQEHEFDYFATGDFQAVDLPYGSGEFRMTLLLPSPGTDINAFIGSFNQAQWDQWMAGFTTRLITLSMPRFKLDYERKLNDDLKALGMAIAFDPNAADFTGMYPPGGLFISMVKQKAFVEVNEEGTEAAAATVVEVGVTSAPQPTAMRVDRPFVFAIRERQSGTILFIGKIVAPETG